MLLNFSIVLADQELQMVFDSWYIFVPDIIENHLLSHVIPAPVDISNDLQNKHMIEDFFVLPFQILILKF